MHTRKHRAFLHAAAPIALLFASLQLQAQWRAAGPGGGGALFNPALSPHDARLFVTSDMTPLLVSEDAGHAWTMVDFRQAQGGRNARVQFTSDPLVLYLLNHRQEIPAPAISRDGGHHWQPLAAQGLPEGEALALYADPQRSDRLVVSTYENVYLSDDSGATFAPIYTAATDAGVHVAGVVFDGGRILLGSNDGLLASQTGNALLQPITVPGLPENRGLFSMAGTAREAGLVLVATILPNDDLYAGMVVEEAFEAFGGVVVLDLAQPTPEWREWNEGIDDDDAPVLVAASAADASAFWLAGIDPTGSEYPVVYRGDGAAPWQLVLDIDENRNVATGWAGDGGDRNWDFGGGLVGLGVDPADARRAAVTDYGFMHLTEDGGQTWRQVYVDANDANPAGAPTPKGRAYRGSGLQDTSAWSIAWTAPEAFFVGFTDIRGVRTTDAGEKFSFDYTGHAENSMYRVVRHSNGALYAATATRHDIYQSTYLTDARIDSSDGRVIVSHDDGASWELVHDFGRAVVWIELDPANPQRAYAALAHSIDGGVYATDDLLEGNISTWRKLPEPPGTQGHAYNVRALPDGSVLASYSGHRDAQGRFQPRSGVFLLDAEQTEWSDRSHENMRFWTKDVVVDTNDPAGSTWYAGVASGFNNGAAGTGGLYRTTDKGETWLRISDLDRVESITLHPHQSNEAYVTTEGHGLFHTRNLDAPAPTFVQDQSYPFHQPLRVFFSPFDAREIWATSFGGGLFVKRSAQFDRFADGFE
jgi:photosystem II stability/assembly factor-like uncharacterized protein